MLAIYQSVAFTLSGGLAVAPTADVEVRDEATGSLASIFSDVDGVTPITQPGFQADANGRFAFYIPGGLYKITLTKNAEVVVLRHVAIGLAASYDATTFTGSFLSSEDAATAVNTLGLKIPLERAQRRARHFAVQNYI